MKLNKLISIRGTELKEFRGISVATNKFVYGGLITTVEERPIDYYLAIGNSEPRKIFKISQYDQFTEKQFEIEVIPESIGQLISEHPLLYEGDILIHPDYENCYFEFQWSDINHGWVPKLIYGSFGNIYLRSFPKLLEDYKISGIKEDFIWYPKALPRYYNKYDYGIFMGYHDDIDIYYDSIMGDSGNVYGIKGEEKFEYRSQDKACEEIPWLKEELKNRKLTKE